MAKRGFLAGHGIARNAIKKDIRQFAIPGMTLFFIELLFCADSLSGFWGTIWGLVKQPQNLSLFPVQSIIGLALTLKCWVSTSLCEGATDCTPPSCQNVTKVNIIL